MERIAARVIVERLINKHIAIVNFTNFKPLSSAGDDLG